MSGSAGGRAEQGSPHGEHLAARPTQPPGYTASAACGSARNDATTSTRLSSEAKAQFRAGRRVYRPWVTEPGLWLQYDFGDGPTIGGRKTTLWCAWLAWSRFRLVIPIWDKTLPTITACLDATFRRIGGVPAYVLTDNEKTVTTDHVAGIAVRNPEIVEVARHYGAIIRTCLPADPETKGGSEATVRIAKADLVPKDVNLREHYKTFGELEAACRSFCDEVNSRTHRATRRKPAERLAEEQPKAAPAAA
jgi:transposase